MAGPLKLLMLGDGAVGKSCLLISYTTKSFPSEYVPTVFDNYCVDIMKDGKPYSLALWDTAGQEDYDRLRPLSYPGTDVFLLCFSVESPSSLENITEKWMPELDHFMGTDGPPIFLVACKSDLRHSLEHRPGTRIISYEEGKKVADKFGLPYIETSALTFHNLKECFDQALDLAISHNGGAVKKRKRKGGFGLFDRLKKQLPDPPVMPPAGKAPYIEIETSTFAENWKSMLDNPSHTDITFIVEGKHRVKAHRVVIESSSTYFLRVLRGLKPLHLQQESQLDKLKDVQPFSSVLLSQGGVPGIQRAYIEDTEDKKTAYVIEIAPDIPGKIFAYVLQFLYTGVPQFDDDTADDEIESLKNVSKTFRLGELEKICLNRQGDEEFLNPSIGTYLNDETGKTMKELFFRKPHNADVIFNVEGEKVYAHKAILSARCDVLSAMFSGHFREGSSGDAIEEINIYETSCENFLALLEYLYTDHAPVEEGDAIGILLVADQFCVSRLITLCELYITFEVDKKCSKQIEKSEIDVIGLLLGAQAHNAEQLGKWCLHFVSTNYQPFKQRQEFCQLTGSNLEYVTEHQWPPLSYLQEVEQYEKAVANKGQTCAIM